MKGTWLHEDSKGHKARAYVFLMTALMLNLPVLAQSAAPDQSDAVAAESAGEPGHAVAGLLRSLVTPGKDMLKEDRGSMAAGDLREESTSDVIEIEVESSSRDESPPDIHVSPAGRVEMHVNNLALSRVLQMLSIQSRRNIVASRAVSGSVTADLYGVTFEEALTAILDSNGCTWRERGNFIYVHTKDELRELEASSRPMVERLFRLHYVRAADAKALIAPLLSSSGIIATTPEAESGFGDSGDGAGGDAMALGDCLIIVDYPDRLNAIERRIAELDVRPQQVLVEATILRAQLNEDNALGIDFNVVGGVDFEGLNAVSPGITDLTTGNLPQNLMDSTSFTTRTDFNQAVPNGGFTFGLIKNNIGVFVRALETITDTTVLANPKVLTLNKQHGAVLVGRRDGYLTTTVTETAAVQNVEFLETGTQLRFRPFIGNDGYIRMEVHPADSTGGVTAANLPFEQTTEVKTNILVRDGHTILIGGLFREVSTTSRGQVPLIGNLPVAGALFRNTADSTQREEVIILLTVHIVKDTDRLAESGRELAEDIERMRVGTRRGLQWFGRERLAQVHYQWALEHLEAGDIDKALWDLDMALNNSPTFTAALKKKEQVLGRRQWEEDNTSIRDFVGRMIMKEHGTVVPQYGRPEPTPPDTRTHLDPTQWNTGHPDRSREIPNASRVGFDSEKKEKAGADKGSESDMDDGEADEVSDTIVTPEEGTPSCDK